MRNGNRFFDKKGNGQNVSNSPLIVNATAPVVEITIVVDNRFNPPAIQMKCSREIEGPILCKVLIYCISTILDMLIGATKGQAPIPDLPPAPAKTE